MSSLSDLTNSVQAFQEAVQACYGGNLQKKATFSFFGKVKHESGCPSELREDESGCPSELREINLQALCI